MKQHYEHLVSIVLPIYLPNITYLEAVLKSISAQTYKKIELIISIDGDPKGVLHEATLDLINNYTCKIIFNEGENGIFSNLNNAIKHASGELIQIFCQDDVMYPNFIEKQVKALSIYPKSGFVYAQNHQINQDGLIISDTSVYYTGLTSCRGAQESIDLLFKYGCLPGNLSPVMIRKCLIKEIGSFNPEIKYAGDFDYWIRICQNGWGMSINYEQLLQIRTHQDRASNTIGRLTWVRDITRLYENLINITEINKSKLFKETYFNFRSGRQIVNAVIMSKSPILISLMILGNLFYPFNIYKMILSIILNKITNGKYFRLDSLNIDDELKTDKQG